MFSSRLNRYDKRWEFSIHKLHFQAQNEWCLRDNVPVKVINLLRLGVNQSREARFREIVISLFGFSLRCFWFYTPKRKPEPLGVVTDVREEGGTMLLTCRMTEDGFEQIKSLLAHDVTTKATAGEEQE